MWNKVRWISILASFCCLLQCFGAKQKHSIHLDPHWNDFKLNHLLFYTIHYFAGRYILVVQSRESFDYFSKRLFDRSFFIEELNEHNKTYLRTKEHHHRMAWEENFHHINKHNEEAKEGKHNYTLELNHLADLPIHQYNRHFTRLSTSKLMKTADNNSLPHHHTSSLPEELDWREKGFNTPGWNQLECGACYAFSIAAMLEGQLFKATGQLHTLSSQQIIDCSMAFGNLGCAGGSLKNTLLYIQKVGGIMQGSEYSYKAKKMLCHFKKSKAIAQISKISILPPYDEHKLKAAVALIGPISVSVNASPKTFQLYSSGVYDDPACSSSSVNHAMLLVGYTKHAWILKNWWSSKWGDNGYMYLARGKNQCAVSSYAAYATIL